MEIYVAHSSSFDFISNLYKPIKNSNLVTKYHFIFPHEKPDTFVNSKKVIKKCDLVIAEVSYPSTGLGIELCWADIFKTPILLLHKDNITPTKSLQVLESKIFSYQNSDKLVKVVSEYLSQF